MIPPYFKTRFKSEPPYLHAVYRRHFLCNLHRDPFVCHFPSQQGSGLNVLLYSSSRKYSVQFRSQSALREQRENHAVGYERLQSFLAVQRAVDAYEHLLRLALDLLVFEETLWKRDVVEEV